MSAERHSNCSTIFTALQISIYISILRVLESHIIQWDSSNPVFSSLNFYFHAIFTCWAAHTFGANVNRGKCLLLAVLLVWHAQLCTGSRGRGTDRSLTSHFCSSASGYKVLQCPESIDRKLRHPSLWDGVLWPRLPLHMLAHGLGGMKIWAAEKSQFDLTLFLWMGSRAKLLCKKRWQLPSPGVCRTRLAQVHVQGARLIRARSNFPDVHSKASALQRRPGCQKEAPCFLHTYQIG